MPQGQTGRNTVTSTQSIYLETKTAFYCTSSWTRPVGVRKLQLLSDTRCVSLRLSTIFSIEQEVPAAITVDF